MRTNKTAKYLKGNLPQGAKQPCNQLMVLQYKMFLNFLKQPYLLSFIVTKTFQKIAKRHFYIY